jgi:hypothetical protein
VCCGSEHTQELSKERMYLSSAGSAERFVAGSQNPPLTRVPTAVQQYSWNLQVLNASIYVQ